MKQRHEGETDAQLQARETLAVMVGSLTSYESIVAQIQREWSNDWCRGMAKRGGA